MQNTLETGEGRRSICFTFCSFLKKLVFLWPRTIASSCMKLVNSPELNLCLINARYTGQRILLDRTPFSYSRETPSGFNLNAALTFSHKWFCSVTKGNLVFKDVFSPKHTSVWKPIILSGQVVARPHICANELRLACVAWLSSEEGCDFCKDNDCCRIAERRHFTLKTFFQFFCRCKPLVISIFL